MNDLKKTLKEAFQDKDYRHGYVDEFLNAYIATQIKVLREQHKWTQKELADHAGMLQPRISVMENVNYSSWSINKLRKIAEAFDLTLHVSFESFSNRLAYIENFNRINLERCFFKDDSYFKESTEYAKVRELPEAPIGTNHSGSTSETSGFSTLGIGQARTSGTSGTSGTFISAPLAIQPQNLIYLADYNREQTQKQTKNKPNPEQINVSRQINERNAMIGVTR